MRTKQGYKTQRFLSSHFFAHVAIDPPLLNVFLITISGFDISTENFRDCAHVAFRLSVNVPAVIFQIFPQLKAVSQ